ncbi:MAG: YqgE/AlgH family protein [Acidobacteriia bacterium]|nr:YqgE/AlgH family protein [Terriglobia bacterium]
MRTTAMLLTAVFLLGGVPGQTAIAQEPPGAKELAPGVLLVASRELRDPNFRDSVVLLIHYDRSGAMGLIINRPVKLRLEELLEELPEARGMKDPAYEGGPVTPQGVWALFRSTAKPPKTVEVMPGVFLISSERPMVEALKAGANANTFRIFVGYSGWGAGQLEREVDIGAWHIFRADADTVFSADPSTVWRKLIRRTEFRIALRHDYRFVPLLKP